MATYAEAADEHAAERDIGRPLQAALVEALNAGAINPWCGLCFALAEGWRIEIARTRFRSMADAAPEMARLEALQRIAREARGGGATVH